MPNLTLFETFESSERLSELIERLEESPGYGDGRDVRKDKEIPGKYILIIHNGEEDLGRHSVRVLEGRILAGKASSLIEGILRREKIRFARYENVQVQDPNAQVPKMQIPKKPECLYLPCL